MKISPPPHSPSRSSIERVVSALSRPQPACFLSLLTILSVYARFVSVEDLMCLLNDIHKTNSGPVERALREADIEHIGQVHTGNQSRVATKTSFLQGTAVYLIDELSVTHSSDWFQVRLV